MISSSSAIVVLALVASASAWSKSCLPLCPPDTHRFCTMQVYAGCPAKLAGMDLIKKHEPFLTKAVSNAGHTSVGYSFALDSNKGWWNTEMAAVKLDFEKVRGGQQAMTAQAADVLLGHYLSTFVVGSVNGWMGGKMATLPASVQAGITDMWYQASQADNAPLKTAFAKGSWTDISEAICQMPATRSTTALRCRYCEFAQLVELCVH
eukprot:m51a1_g14288 hypothetical protein (207) ;mRNA; r:397344-398219